MLSVLNNNSTTQTRQKAECPMNPIKYLWLKILDSKWLGILLSHCNGKPIKGEGRSGVKEYRAVK